MTAVQVRATRERERSSRALFGKPQFVEHFKERIRDTFNPEDPELMAERESDIAAQQLLLEIGNLEKEKNTALSEYRSIARARGVPVAKRSTAFLQYNRLKDKIAGKRSRLNILDRSSETMQDTVADELTMKALALNNRAAAASRRRQKEHLNVDDVFEDTEENFLDQTEMDERFLNDFATLTTKNEGYLDGDLEDDDELRAINDEVDMENEMATQTTRELLIDLPSVPGDMHAGAADEEDLESWLMS